MNNAKVFRLSEVYLIAAEAALKTNNPDAAKYIDDLRKERIAGYAAGTTTSVTLDDILTERRLEAEAALKTNNPDAAKYIDDLRKERIAGYAAGTTTSVTLDDILTERRLELNGEGHMAWDMWRNGKSVNNPICGVMVSQ